MRELTRRGGLGDIYHYDSVRINGGLFQSDVSVLWGLAVHDVSVMDYVLGAQPTAVSTTRLAHVTGQPENIAYMTMLFDSPLNAPVHANRPASVKMRRTLLGGTRRIIMFHDLETTKKMKVYDRGISVNTSPGNIYEMLVGYRTDDMWAPQLAVSEALSAEAAHFLGCVANGTRPTPDGEAGPRVVRLLEAATASIVQQERLTPVTGAVV